MVSGIDKKLKVIWICHFTNEIIQDKLKICKEIKEFAPWITIGIEEARKRNDIELYIVSPHRWISGNKAIVEGNIHYYFFNSGIPFYGRHWPKFFRFDIATNFYSNKRKIRKIVYKINPDIIHLHGLENHYYSSTVSQFINKYPILATIQGFITLQLPKGKLNIDTRKKAEVEILLLKTLKNFGVRNEPMKNEILKYNNEANLFWHEYFSNIPGTLNDNNKEEVKLYDLIFFSRISKEKGVEDLIIAAGILKPLFPKIKIAIIGSANNTYINKLKRSAVENSCADNIEFLGFLPTQEDIFKILIKSKICVLPTYNDIVPGTIIESMLRKVPVVSYKTGGIPDINKKNEIILLSQQGDINGLVYHIKTLLQNEKLRKEYAERALSYATKRWNNEESLNDIINAYKSIIENEFNKKNILEIV